jgi:Rhodopirellula transposase DDE domain
VSDENLADRFEAVLPHLNERQQRIMAGAVARACGYGGVKAVALASGLSLSKVQAGARKCGRRCDAVTAGPRAGCGAETSGSGSAWFGGGAGRFGGTGDQGGPECSLRWTTKSLRKLADDLVSRGFTVSPPTVGQLLAAAGYSLQAPVKTKEGADHPDRSDSLPEK